MERSKVASLVLDCIISFNDTLPASDQIKVSEKMKLFNSESALDSLSLVNIIVDIEDRMNEEFDLDISLTDDRAMTREISPFESVDTLIDYILELVNE